MDDNLSILERLAGRGAVPAADSLSGGAVLPERRARHLLHLKLSIRDKILLALLMVVFLMGVPYVFLIVPGMEYKTQ